MGSVQRDQGRRLLLRQETTALSLMIHGQVSYLLPMNQWFHQLTNSWKE